MVSGHQLKRLLVLLGDGRFAQRGPCQVAMHPFSPGRAQDILRLRDTANFQAVD